jgi:hypothetical protein
MPDDVLSSLKANFEFYSHEYLLRLLDYQTPVAIRLDRVDIMLC